MLPDFRQAKKHARSLALRAVRNEIDVVSPILQGIRRTVIHEGRGSTLTRADGSSETMTLGPATGEVTISREQMRAGSIEDIKRSIHEMASQLAEHQTRTLFQTVSDGAERVGNSVDARTLGAKEAFLEMQRRVQVDFDPVTLQPKNLAFVLHPSQFERFTAQIAQWEQDPAFRAEMTRLRQQQLEDWRARENSRQLAD